jgi:glutamyl-tRNA synthetase
MSSRPVRVRIGPSPTGEPHVGTAYVALFNTAVAKKHGGKFVLRIEDTDQERSKPEWEREIMNGLRWLGLTWDEGPDVGGPYGPYRQSERTAIYQAHANILLERGTAYRCFCTRERLDALREAQKAAKASVEGYDRFCRDLEPAEVERRLAAGEPHVVRLKMPVAGQTIVPDRLRGDVAFENTQIDDQVLLKSDGFPTYHLANVVDDHLMEITHVIRAEEWINSTPKHLVLYQAFGWEPPEFYHLPLLRNDDKSKISKRKNPVSILDYKQRGFLPRAVLNYLAMMGWTMPDGRELFSVEDFIANFDWSRMSLGGPIFDLGKLAWLNGKYYREVLTDDELAALVREQLFREEHVRRIVPLIRERIDTLDQFVPATEYFFAGELPAVKAEDLKPKKRTYKEVHATLEQLSGEIDRQIDFSAPALEALCRGFAERTGWGTKDLFMPIRVALTGRNATPPLFDVMSVLGRALVRRRIRAALELAKRAAQDEAKQAQAEAQAAAKAEKDRKKAEEAAPKAGS